MDPENIDYASFLQEAMQESLRAVVRRVLEQVEEHGLPGEHHLLIGFRTAHPGVEVPRFLRDQYPEEVTIVLQHQFWGLEVSPEAFSLLLSFNGSRQRVMVPFAAVTAFGDPSVNFGLRLDAMLVGLDGNAPADPEPAPPPEKPAPRADGVIPFDPSRRR
jgi:uncharacterized protein